MPQRGVSTRDYPGCYFYAQNCPERRKTTTTRDATPYKSVVEKGANMKRKFLEDMGLAKEQVDSIMAENGNDIEAIKQERDTYKGQLETAQSTLKSFEGVNISELQTKVTTLTNDLATREAEYKKQLADRDF